MKTIAPQPHYRPVVILSTSVAALLLISGCSLGSGDAKPATTEQSRAESTVAAMPTSAAATEEATPTPDAGTAAETTKPGTALKTNQAAQLLVTSGKKGEPKYKEASVNYTITDITAGKPSDLAKFKDAAKFAGQTPYYVHATAKLDAISGPTAGMSDPRVQGHLKDGTAAQKIILFGKFDACDSSNYELTGKGDDLSYKVGSTKTICTLFLAPAGDAITSVSYDGNGLSSVKYSDNPFRGQPITWTN